jgi:hypothetical protein
MEQKLVFKTSNPYYRGVSLNEKVTLWLSSFLSGVFSWDSPWASRLWPSWPPGAIASNSNGRGRHAVILLAERLILGFRPGRRLPARHVNFPSFLKKVEGQNSSAGLSGGFLAAKTPGKSALLINVAPNSNQGRRGPCPYP